MMKGVETIKRSFFYRLSSFFGAVMNRVILKPLAFTLILGAGMVANADVIINTFGTVTSPGFDDAISWTVDPTQSMAKQFSPSFGTYTLDEIDIALMFQTQTSTINVSLCADNAGSPGSVLETFSVVNAGTLSFGSLYVLNSAAHPTMTMGGNYYVTITPGDANSQGGWNFTNDGHNGDMQYSTNGGSTWTGFNNTDGAVTVQGKLSSVPEPASMVVLGLGVLSLVRRRRSTK
jgi:hypothetical protein